MVRIADRKYLNNVHGICFVIVILLGLIGTLFLSKPVSVGITGYESAEIDIQIPPSSGGTGTCVNKCGVVADSKTCYCDMASVSSAYDYCSDIQAACPDVWAQRKGKQSSGGSSGGIVQQKATATLSLGGKNYKVVSSSFSSITNNDFDIHVDSDASGVIGDYNIDIVGNENSLVTKDYYLFFVGYGLLQYKGADKSTADNSMMRFKDMKTGSVIEVVYQIKGNKAETAEATLSLGGKNYLVRSGNSININQNDFGIIADTSGSGEIGDKNTPVTGYEYNSVILKDTYFYLKNYGMLEYKGADKSTADNPMMRFKDMQTGQAIELAYSVASGAQAAQCTESDLG